MSAWSRRFVLSVTIVALAAYARPAQADPIVVTGGVVGVANGLDFPGFHITGVSSDLGGVLPIVGVLCCTFNSGDTVALNMGFPIGTLPSEPGPETVEGTHYSSVFVSGGIRFSTVPFIAPPSNGLTSFSFTTPFTMTGQLDGFADQAHTQPLFSVGLIGSGTARVSGTVHATQPNFIGQAVGFTFQEPAPTPEPASLALLGIGITGVCIRRWSRKKPHGRR